MPIYGAGCTDKPELFFIFMNPTQRNVSSMKDWPGIRAPWIGTKNIWKFFLKLNLLSKELFSLTQTLDPDEWTPLISRRIYQDLASRKIYITNFAKCTQPDARPLSGKIFKEYQKLMYQEIVLVRPRNIVTFGNQVSSILLGRKITISRHNGLPQPLILGKVTFTVYPVYYPVGQGMRNMSQAVDTIGKILNP